MDTYRTDSGAAKQCWVATLCVLSMALRAAAWTGDESAPAGAVGEVRLLPGAREFVFSLYGAPGDLPTVRELVQVLRRESLANGFDPGPGPGPGAKAVFDYLATERWPVVFYSGGEMQIRGGRAVFGPEHEASIQPMDRAGVFTAYQLGEWGYYFHNLAPRESWWRDVYGKEFEAYKHLMKPAGLAGYDRRPNSRRECYEIVREYFLSRRRDLLGRVISVTGHSHYEAYVAEWGARCVGLEVAENIAFTQSKFAFARGAARAWQRPWSVQVSPWFHGACTTQGPLRKEGGGARGLDAGHSLSLYERLWLHAWFAGAAMVTPENSIAIFFEKPEAPWNLTEHGRRAVEVFRLMRSHDRGVPHTPVAVVLDRYAGYNGYMDRPWGILDPTPGDREARDLFDTQLFPGADHLRTKLDPANPEAGYLRPTPYGEMFDVLLTSAPPEVFAAYPVLLLVGDIEFEVGFLGEMEKALRRGTRVLLSERHRSALGKEFERVARQGRVEVLSPWVNPATGRSAAVSEVILRELVRDHQPIEVSGDAIQYQINRTARGWVVELINNHGVAKFPDRPAVVDSGAVARVRLTPRGGAGAATLRARAWRQPDRELGPGTIEIMVAPGSVEFVAFE